MSKLKLTVTCNNESVDFYVEDGTNATLKLGNEKVYVKAEEE
jgi:hypothetical protein